jgi:hypothetical protein
MAIVQILYVLLGLLGVGEMKCLPIILNSVTVGSNIYFGQMSQKLICIY